MTKIESGIVQTDIFESENISGIFRRIVENVISPSGFAQTDAFKAFRKDTAAVAVGIKLCNDFVAFFHVSREDAVRLMLLLTVQNYNPKCVESRQCDHSTIDGRGMTVGRVAHAANHAPVPAKPKYIPDVHLCFEFGLYNGEMSELLCRDVHGNDVIQ